MLLFIHVIIHIYKKNKQLQYIIYYIISALISTYPLQLFTILFTIEMNIILFFICPV